MKLCTNDDQICHAMINLKLEVHAELMEIIQEARIDPMKFGCVALMVEKHKIVGTEQAERLLIQINHLEMK